jgi:hypothetical protein
MFVLLLIAGGLMAQAPPSTLVTLNENGPGSLMIDGAPPTALPCALAPDPGPGGLASAFTCDLLGASGLVAGDLLLFEGNVMSDILRFNSTATGSVVFYSDISDGADALADTGFPLALYTNTVSAFEIGPEGANGFVYTPTANQPGFVPGFSVTYDITSDAAPEPATASLILIAGIALFGARARRTPRP